MRLSEIIRSEIIRSEQSEASNQKRAIRNEQSETSLTSEV